MEKKKLRKNWIDAAKAIAIFIVVLNHSELRIPGVNFWGGMFFVPAFFLLAGYTYHPSEGSYALYLKNKVKRLLLPYAIANVLLFALFAGKALLTGGLTADYLVKSLVGIVYGRNQIFATGDNPIYLMLNLNAPTWFLPALFVALAFTEGLFKWFRQDEKKVLLTIVICALLATVYHYFVPVLLPWCLELMPFFMLMMFAGYSLKRYGLIEAEAMDQSSKKKYIRIFGGLGVFVATIAAGLINGSCNLSVSDTGKSITLMLVSAIGSSVLLMVTMCAAEIFFAKCVGAISFVGRHTLFILCYHYVILQVCLGIGRMVLPKYVVGYQILSIVVSVAACTIADVIIHKIKVK